MDKYEELQQDLEDIRKSIKLKKNYVNTLRKRQSDMLIKLCKEEKQLKRLKEKKKKLMEEVKKAELNLMS